MIMTADQARKILEVNLVNLAKKTAVGKPLSAQELALVQAAAEGAEAANARPFVDNQVELSEALGVTRKTIQRWLKDSGCPGACPNGKYNVPAWREWVRRSGKRKAVSEDDSEDIDAVRERARNILLQNQRLEVQIGILRREYIPCAESERLGAELGVAIRKVVCKLHLQAPSLAGLTVPELEARLREMEDEMIRQLHTLDDGHKQMKEQQAESDAA